MNSRRILFVIRDFYPSISASGHVLHLLVTAAKDSDCEIGIICRNTGKRISEEKQIGNLTIYRYADTDSKSKICTCINKIHKQFDTRLYSNRKIHVYNAIDYMVNKYGYSTMIPITVDEIYACIDYKTKNASIRLIPYLFEKIPTYNSFCIANKLRIKNEELLKEQLINESERILVFPVLESYFDVCDKIVITDHPMVINNTNSRSDEGDDRITVTYVGGLDRRIRNPLKVLDVFSKVFNHTDDLEVNFYGYGNCDQILIDFEREHPANFSYHGAIDGKRASEILKHSDFLITIGNCNSVLVPSKIFDCISTGKPIIHFYFERDSYIERLQKYPLSLCIDLSLDSAVNADKLLKFISTTKGKTIPYSYIKSAYSECTPEHVFNIILSYC